jgi:hypothetical protein
MQPPNPPPPPPRPLRTLKPPPFIIPKSKKHPFRTTFGFSHYPSVKNQTTFRFSHHPTQFHGLPDPNEQEIESRLLGLHDAMHGLKIQMDATFKLFIPPRIAKANSSVKTAFEFISYKMSRHTDELRDESLYAHATTVLCRVNSFMKDAAELFDRINPMVATMMGLSSRDPRVSLVNDIVRLIDRMNVPLDRLDSHVVYTKIMTETNRHGNMTYAEIQEKLELVFPDADAFIQTVIDKMRERAHGCDAINCRRLIQILMNENEIMNHPLMKLFKSNKAVYRDFFYPGDILEVDHHNFVMWNQHQIIRKMCGKNIKSWNIPLDKSITPNDLITNDSPYSDKVNRLIVFGRKEYLGDLPKDIADEFKRFQKEVLWLSGGKSSISKSHLTKKRNSKSKKCKTHRK